MNEFSQLIDDPGLADLLRRSRRIAMVGASPRAGRPSNGVMRYLLAHGYDVVPVNPGHAGETIAGRTAVGQLADIEGPVDLVDVFRRSDALAGVVAEVLALPERPAVLWTQLGVVDEAAAATAREAGLTVVSDRCIKIEHARLIG